MPGPPRATWPPARGRDAPPRRRLGGCGTASPIRYDAGSRLPPVPADDGPPRRTAAWPEPPSPHPCSLSRAYRDLVSTTRKFAPLRVRAPARSQHRPQLAGQSDLRSAEEGGIAQRLATARAAARTRALTRRRTPCPRSRRRPSRRPGRDRVAREQRDDQGVREAGPRGRRADPVGVAVGVGGPAPARDRHGHEEQPDERARHARRGDEEVVEALDGPRRRVVDRGT